MKIGIIAALPREVSELVRGWELLRLPGRVAVFIRGDAVVACAGMGATRAAMAVQAAMAALPVTELISVGLAGACNPAMRVGEIVRAGIVVNALTGERFSYAPYEQVLVSTDGIASVAEKARLNASYSADAVDMEAAAVARLARANGLDFHAIKAISDKADFEMKGLSRFSDKEGYFREAAFALHAVVRPVLWSSVIALARNSSKAIDALTEALRGEIDWYRKNG